MPTYEYKNIETGEIYEFRQSMRDDAYTQHPETGAAIKRIVSVPGIAFKGSGFYANDSRSAASKPAAKSGSSDSASDSSSDNGPSRSGPAESNSSKGEKSASDSAPAPVKAPEKSASKSGE